ncbi:2-oxoglutarate and Fe(II)-dependent oxygenase superfamily protein, partial [Prunus dulcis]
CTNRRLIFRLHLPLRPCRLTAAPATAVKGPRRPALAPMSSQRLRLIPNKDHNPDNYDDMELDFSPSIFTSLERFLPPSMLGMPRHDKVKFMTEILLKYLPHGERNRVQKHRDYRQKIISNYQPLHRELYSMHPATTFVAPFLKAVSDNTEESFRRIMSEPSPGVFTFEMFQPQFCELLLSEVENFEKWVNEAKFRIMRPNTMNKYGAVLDDFGLETMLDKLMENFIRPISKVFFAEVGGSTLDSHHGFVVEYGEDRDADLGFHVDDSEVTLNVCLGKQFSGGELFFRGTRCDKHVNSGSHSEDVLCFIVAVTGMVLEQRHQVIASIYFYGAEEMKKYQKDFSSWCGECLREKKERQRISIRATKRSSNDQKTGLLLMKLEESCASV